MTEKQEVLPMLCRAYFEYKNKDSKENYLPNLLTEQYQWKLALLYGQQNHCL